MKIVHNPNLTLLPPVTDVKFLPNERISCADNNMLWLFFFKEYIQDVFYFDVICSCISPEKKEIIYVYFTAREGSYGYNSYGSSEILYVSKDLNKLINQGLGDFTREEFLSFQKEI